MTTMNGAKHDVEDILASIRTSIADRSPSFDLDRRELDRREPRVATLRGRASIADEAVDFELPAIFKAPAHPVHERPNLLGRLSEVLNSGSQQSDWGRSRTVIPFEPAHGRMIEPPPVALEAQNAANGQSATSGRTAESGDVKRIMPTFFDTRLNRMGELSRVVAEPPSAPPPQQAEPPRLPDGPYADAGNGAIEDAAAQLLRPILKQWLTENMPKIVEKALRSEESGGPRRH